MDLYTRNCGTIPLMGKNSSLENISFISPESNFYNLNMEIFYRFNVHIKKIDFY